MPDASPLPLPREIHDSLCIWKLDPLPDFLTDHTLTGDHLGERLKEYAARWVQFAGSLWEWRDRAALALRYFAREGTISVYLLARAHSADEQHRLQAQIWVLMRAHRLLEGTVRPMLTGSEFEIETRMVNPAILELHQLETRTLWEGPGSLPQWMEKSPLWTDLPPEEFQAPRVVYPWWGPGGPFLLPMESLISQKVACSITIYLAPTELHPLEREWLAYMAREAQTRGEQNLQNIGFGAPVREVDPIARLAGRLYMANLRRLSATPFQVNVHCASDCGDFEAALSLAGAVQSLVHEPAFERPQQEDDRLPSGASVIQPKSEKEASEMLRQYHDLSFAAWNKDDPLARIHTLADPQGAATVFRLPVGVRGGVPGVRVRQLSPNFHPGARETSPPTGAPHINLGQYHSGGEAYMPLADLTKHVLITGFTGSGKTVTVLQLLHQLWADHKVAFLVLESAKQEYRGLFDVEAFRDDLRVYTLGNETCVPLRLNPFELLPGVRVEAHLGKLQTCIEGAVPAIGPSSSVINEALLRVYEEFGWSLTDSYPLEGSAHRRFPVLKDFVHQMEVVIKSRKYGDELENNLKAAMIGRFQPLLIGSKGRMFDTQRSSPSPSDLFTRPTILEMNDLTLDDKALVVMFVLTILREYRERDKSILGELKHITMLEEAHNILEDVKSNAGGEGSTSSDARYKAVQAFCSLLTEIRSLGEGLIIADQSPEKLARDAMRNTNLQIAHQLRDGHDRSAIANAMIMEDEQRDFLGKLPPGHAALFRTGLEKATFIKIAKFYPTQDDMDNQPVDRTSAEWQQWAERFRGFGFNPHILDDDIRRRMREATPGSVAFEPVQLPYTTCYLCRTQCLHRDVVFPIEAASREEGLAWFRDMEGQKQADDGIDTLNAISTGCKLAIAQLRAAALPADEDQAWCYFSNMLDRAKQAAEKAPDSFQLDEEIREVFSKQFHKHSSYD